MHDDPPYGSFLLLQIEGENILKVQYQLDRLRLHTPSALPSNAHAESTNSRKLPSLSPTCGIIRNVLYTARLAVISAFSAIWTFERCLCRSLRFVHIVGRESLTIIVSVYDPDCRLLTSRLSLQFESNKDQCFNRPYQVREALQSGVFLIFLSEIFLQTTLLMRGVKV